MAKYYIDTSIWRDYYENRADNLRPLGEWAFELFKKIRANNEIALYSDLVVDELLERFTEAEVRQIFNILAAGRQLKRLAARNEQIKEAIVIARELKTPYKDTLHAILARDNSAILVTRDKHFLQLQEVVKIMKPEELI
jgi:predicted nucleic acid-binding protein